MVFPLMRESLLLNVGRIRFTRVIKLYMILYIGSFESLRDSGEDTILMMTSFCLAYQVKKNGSVKRVNVKNIFSNALVSIRVWSKEAITPEMFSIINTITIHVKEVIADGIVYNLGDDSKAANDNYTIREITPDDSRKNGCYLSRNSMTLSLAN